jgi:glycosyltransferase involved in cell wall biosynthesis
MPRVSVIIPTFNWSTVLPYSIGSALDQTFSDLEILVVGDGCTDDSAEVVAAIGDPRVRWIDLQPRFGHQSGPNNEGLRQARGELIAYLGHDDLWLPNHLALAVAAIDAGADLTYSFIASVPAGGGPLRLRVPRRPGLWIPPTLVVHRRQLTERVGGWRDYRELYDDPEVDLWRRMRAAGFAFVFLPRLTAIKIAAATRRDVYRSRPCHEQAAWLERIRSQPDLEVVELGRTVGLLSEQVHQPRMTARIRRFFSPAWWMRRLSRKKGAHIRRGQRFKGVES